MIAFYSIIIYFIWVILFFFTGLLVIIIGFLYKPLVYPIIRIMAYINLYCLGAIPYVSGKRPHGSPYIIMYNHSSFIDIFFLPIIASGPFTGIVAKKNFKIPIFSWILKKFDAISIQRRDKDNALLSIAKAEQVLTNGISVGILPEGTRTLDGKMLPLKKGGFHMAINSKYPILPVGIKGAFKYKPKGRWHVCPCKIEINIGTPIDLHVYNKIRINQLLMIVEKQIKLLSGELNESK